MRKFFLLLALVLFLPLEARAAEISSDVTGGIEVHEDAGIMPLAFGYDGYRSYMLLPAPYVLSNLPLSRTVYYDVSYDVIKWNVFSTYVSEADAVSGAGGVVEFDVPIIFSGSFNPYDTGQGSFTGLFVYLSNFRFSVSASNVYDASSYASVTGYRVSYNGVNGSGEFDAMVSGGALQFHIPSDRALFTVYAHVVVSSSYFSATRDIPLGSLSVSVRGNAPTYNASVYGYVNIPPGEYSNVVNLNTIASQQVTWLHYLDYLDDIYGRTTNLEIISANFRDNTYTQLNNLTSDLGLYYQGIAKALTDTYGLISLVKSDVLSFDANQGVRFQALYGQLSVINHEIQVHMTNENTRLINALLQETEYPDGDAGAGMLEDAFGEYDKAESQVTNTAFQWVGGFDPGSLLDFSAQIVLGIGQFNQILTALLAAMGSYQYVVFIGLGLIFVGILVGVFRFRG